ncbi:MAG: GNAT family N-acetyltransferase [Candidatus Brockarchaeota archaeon]|nr:GNAT family N-acetyltransferase [Candidatus Brockarchaeota archaeon]
MRRRKEAVIHSTMVHRQNSRKGIGSTLVQKFLEQAFEQDAELIFTKVERGSANSIEKCGFKNTILWCSMVRERVLKGMKTVSTHFTCVIPKSRRFLEYFQTAVG